MANEAEEGMKLNVLDHGYVQYVEHWGSDERIIESARMSTGKGFQGWDTDMKLLTFLYSHRHMTPFEMCGLTLEIKAPIFVFREWHRHRTQSYNEMSARYIPLPDENYIPSVDRILMQGGSNKQAQSTNAKEMTEGDVERNRILLSSFYKDAQEFYQMFLNEGWPKELARLVVPVGRYSRMRASANLRNWLQFLTLRMDSAAQWEIRQYANTVGVFIAQRFPRTWELFARSNHGG